MPKRFYEPGAAAGTDEAREGLGALGGDLAKSVVDYLEARFLLLSIESREAGANLRLKFGLIASASSVFFIGYLLGVIALVSIIAERSGVHWHFIALIAALIHGIIGCLMVWVALTRLAKPLFEQSLNELNKDREWIRNQKRP